MARPSASPLDRQVARARRRLFLQTLLNTLVRAWIATLVLTAAWFLLRPHAPAGQRWTVLGGTAGAAALVALLLAVLRAPSAVTAALTLDERFRLKERVTTALLLTPQERQSPAGEALLADVNHHLQPLQVGERFPVRVPRSAALLPLGGAALVLLALYYRPAVGTVQAEATEPLAQDVATRVEIERQMKQLQKKDPAKKPGEPPASEELQRLEAELDRLAKQPHETKEQGREAVKQIAGLEDQVKERDRKLAERADALKEQMRQAERSSKKRPPDGPARKLDQALQNADFDKAQDEAERLRKKLQAQEEAERLRRKLQDQKLTRQERQEAQDQLERLKDEELSREQKGQLEEQLQNLQDRLERLTRQQEELQRLRDLRREGKLSPEEQRELDRLAEELAKLDTKDLEELKELAEKLGECKKCLREGKDGEGAKKLADAAGKLARLGDRGERLALARKLEQMRAVKRALCRALDGSPTPASGRRPESKQGETAARETRARSDLDRGRIQVIDHVPGEGFKGPRRPDEMREEIRRAAQEAPEALGRQRLPRSASDMARGYFDKLRGDREKANVERGR